MKKLFQRWGDQVHFVDVFIRQAHPGPEVPPYQSIEQKLEDARFYVEDAHIPWTVAVDDLAGTTHQAYGGLADPTYLIGTDGRVSFYNMWTYAPVLHEALTELTERGGQGVVHGGVDQRPWLLPALVCGWPGLERGLPQSYVDLEMAAPGMGSLPWLGYQLRPVLGPLATRAEPLPSSVRTGMLIGAAALAGLAFWQLRRPKSSPEPEPEALGAC